MFGNRLALGTGFVNCVRPQQYLTIGQAVPCEEKDSKGRQKEHVAGDVTDKGQRQYEHIKKSVAKKKGTKAAKRIAAATVNKGKFGPSRSKGHAKGR